MYKQILVKFHSMKLNENWSSGCGFVTCEQTATGRLIGAFLKIFVVIVPKDVEEGE
jgi:hypothetical protein